MKNAVYNINNIKYINNQFENLQLHIIRVCFQPIYHNKKSLINKFEALARIQKNGNIYYPKDFLYIFKLLKKETILKKAIFTEYFKLIEKEQYKNVEISFNTSITDIIDKHTNELIFNLLDNCRNKEHVTFEIVEDISYEFINC